MNYQNINYPNGFKKIIHQQSSMMPYPSVMPPVMPQQPQMPEMMPQQPQMPTPPGRPPMTQAPPLNLFPVDEGYRRGTMFRGLFQPYKNFQPMLNLPNTDEARMKYEVNKYYFAALELQFYLNNFPNDQEALSIFNDFRRKFNEAVKNYQSRFGALDISSDSLEKSWDWAKIPFPWVGGI